MRWTLMCEDVNVYCFNMKYHSLSAWKQSNEKAKGWKIVLSPQNAFNFNLPSEMMRCFLVQLSSGTYIYTLDL